MGKESKEFKTSYFDSETNKEVPVVYTIQPCGGKAGLRLVLKIVDLIRPNSNEPMKQMDKVNMAKAIMHVTDDKFIDKADKIISEIFEMVYLEFNGQIQQVTDTVFDSYFMGRYDLMLEVIMEVLDYNGFLDLIRQAMSTIPMYFPQLQNTNTQAT